jgi:hypothetical protein
MADKGEEVQAAEAETAREDGASAGEVWGEGGDDDVPRRGEEQVHDKSLRELLHDLRKAHKDLSTLNPQQPGYKVGGGGVRL